MEFFIPRNRLSDILRAAGHCKDDACVPRLCGDFVSWQVSQ
jgi:hypothetical protein